MPRLSKWTIRAALVHFVLGITVGAWMLAAKAGFDEPSALGHRPVHIHFMLFGWLVQLVFGVGYWILPTFGEQRGTTRLAAAAFVALNVGVILGTAAPWVPVLGATGWLLEVSAAALFAVHVWPRVKAFGAS
ncbi:MAG: hypothetical protein ABEL76_04280 [Bradymonadaceae bacterium]